MAQPAENLKAPWTNCVWKNRRLRVHHSPLTDCLSTATMLRLQVLALARGERIYKELQPINSMYEVKSHQMYVYVAISEITFWGRKYAKQIEKQVSGDEVGFPTQPENVIVLPDQWLEVSVSVFLGPPQMDKVIIRGLWRDDKESRSSPVTDS